MKVTLLRAAELTPQHVQTWSDLQRADPAVDSPFFRPEFTQAVAAARDDVEVAVLEQDGAIAGYFPFQRNRWNVGKPVGGRLSDFHGVIGRADLNFDAAALMRACGLAAFDFHNVVASQRSFAPYHWTPLASPFMDLSQGFEAYYKGQQERGSQTLRNSLRRCRKMDRELAPLRYVHNTDDSDVFETFLRWKSLQYQRTSATDIFKFDWTVNVLRWLKSHPTDGCSIMFSALYAGEQLLAVEFNLRSHHVLHGWFPAYNTEFSGYSPGMCLVTKIAEAAPGLDIRRIDMCSGPGRYKESLMSGSIPMARGSVACSLGARVLRAGWRRTKNLAQSGPLRFPKQVAGRLTRPLRGWLAFR